MKLESFAAASFPFSIDVPQLTLRLRALKACDFAVLINGGIVNTWKRDESLQSDRSRCTIQSKGLAIAHWRLPNAKLTAKPQRSAKDAKMKKVIPKKWIAIGDCGTPHVAGQLAIGNRQPPIYLTVASRQGTLREPKKTK